MNRADDEAVFMTDEYRFGIRYRCNSSFGFWQTAYCSKKPLNDANFNAAYDAMTAFKADDGRPLVIKPPCWWCPLICAHAACAAAITGPASSMGPSRATSRRAPSPRTSWPF